MFTRKTSEPLASLVKKIDKKIGENDELKSFVVVIPKKGENPTDDITGPNKGTSLCYR